MRIQRALARAGAASRRHAEELIAAGRVTVNGAVAQVGQRVLPGRDRILVDGRQIGAPVPPTWIALHKAPGVMATRSDPRGRRTVFDCVPKVPGLVYVGRLDYLTSGVLLLTTDGQAAHVLSHPSTELERTYVATVRGNALDAVRAARRGVVLDDGPVRLRDIAARPLGDRRWALEVTIVEGRNREVRRLCAALGLDVERLVRTRFGPVVLGSLPEGASRPLTRKEAAAVQALSAGASA